MWGTSPIIEIPSVASLRHCPTSPESVPHFTGIRRGTEFRSVEFVDNQAPVPGEDGIRFSDAGDLLKRGAAESLADFAEGGPFGIRQAHAGGKVGSEDPILSCEVLILEQEFLIDQPGDVRQEASPFVVWHEEHPS